MIRKRILDKVAVNIEDYLTSTPNVGDIVLYDTSTNKEYIMNMSTPPPSIPSRYVPTGVVYQPYYEVVEGNTIYEINSMEVMSLVYPSLTSDEGSLVPESVNRTLKKSGYVLPSYGTILNLSSERTGTSTTVAAAIGFSSGIACSEDENSCYIGSLTLDRIPSPYTSLTISFDSFDSWIDNSEYDNINAFGQLGEDRDWQLATLGGQNWRESNPHNTALIIARFLTIYDSIQYLKELGYRVAFPSLDSNLEFTMNDLVNIHLSLDNVYWRVCDISEELIYPFRLVRDIIPQPWNTTKPTVVTTYEHVVKTTIGYTVYPLMRAHYKYNIGDKETGIYDVSRLTKLGDDNNVSIDPICAYYDVNEPGALVPSNAKTGDIKMEFYNVEKVSFRQYCLLYCDAKTVEFVGLIPSMIVSAKGMFSHNNTLLTIICSQEMKDYFISNKSSLGLSDTINFIVK